jgi:hypothetical protein
VHNRGLARFLAIGSFALVPLLANAPQASAAVTLGQLAPVPMSGCGWPEDIVQPTVTSGNSYRVPSMPPANALVITSWSTRAVLGVGQNLAMKVFRKIANPATYQVVGHDGPHPLTEGVINTFAANVAVQPGDVLGISTPSNAGNPPCFMQAPGDAAITRLGGNLSDGQSGLFNNTYGNERLNVTAEVTPSNAFSLGDTSRNKKKGTATVTVNLPNPGELSVSGNGVKAASAGRAVISKSVGAGPAQLLIKATGKKKRKLMQTGKVKLDVGIVYTPTGGFAATQSLQVKLKKTS